MAEQIRTDTLGQYILDHLDEAMEQGFIKVYFQPVVRVMTRRICGMEALARWEDPERGLLYPGSFIPVLEEHRLIHKLDIYILRRVCKLFHQEMQGRQVALPVSINLSRLDYELCDIFEQVEQAVLEYRIPREMLCIELTESVLNNNEGLMSQYIRRFRGAGYQVWMDDFGSGYSSLNVLKDYQFDELKIDMRFLSDFHQRSKKILASIIHMAKEISIQTLVEGVETEEQFQFLHDIGCEKAQGYLFSRPLPFEALMEHLKAQSLPLEQPIERHYYDELGQVDLLSSIPFVSQPVQRSLRSGREMNSIPLAIVELRQEQARLLYDNDAFYAIASTLDWGKLFGVSRLEEAAQNSLSLSQLSVHLSQMLEETRESGQGKMYFVDHGEYFEMKAKRVAASGELCAVLLRLDNLSRGSELSRQDQLDAGLRQLYSAYSRVTLLDLNRSTLRLLYTNAREERTEGGADLRSDLEQYCRKWVFWEDQQRFLEFTDPDTIDARMYATGYSYLNTYFRIRIHHGNYIWQLHMLLRVKEGVYYLLARDAAAELRDFIRYSGADLRRLTDRKGRYSPDMLWRNITQNTALKFFWKDEQRRFLGASQSFLDFYGFHSLQDIVGKTDEDMGWHLHPDLFRDYEYEVIHNGISLYNSLGNCIIRGENRNIVASKMPLYDDFGEIVGLFGYFFQIGEVYSETPGKDPRPGIDPLTGLLNAKGLSEELDAYQDELFLRQTPFGRIDVSIADFAFITGQFGPAFGDELIRTVAKALVDCCGTVASISRLKGSEFVIYCQYEQPQELEQLARRVSALGREITDVNGTPITVFLTVRCTEDGSAPV